MLRVKIDNEVIVSIDLFVEWYLNSFLVLFEDSWIDNVELIENNYINAASGFRDNIYDKLNRILSKWFCMIHSYYFNPINGSYFCLKL